MTQITDSINKGLPNMRNYHKMVNIASHDGFEFDYNHNVIFFGGKVIRLSPHEADILRVLLGNRARPTPIGVLIQRVYGANEPDAAAVSIRVAIHSLRKKIQETGMSIRAEPKVGYEILMALNLARSTDEHEIAAHLETALNLAEAKREKWLNQARNGVQSQPALPACAS